MRIYIFSTYCASIGNDTLYVRRSINFARTIGPILCQLWILGNFQREALSISDMPVERVELCKVEILPQKLISECYLDPAHSVESPFDIGHGETTAGHTMKESIITE